MWDPFRIAFKNCVPGSRILVTTRKSRVAEIMESETTINLGVLSEEDCWSIFCNIAFFFTVILRNVHTWKTLLSKYLGSAEAYPLLQRP